VLTAFRIAGQLMICSLTIDDFSAPLRQTQQSSIGNPAIVNFPGMIAAPVYVAGAVVWLRLCRAVLSPTWAGDTESGQHAESSRDAKKWGLSGTVG